MSKEKIILLIVSSSIFVEALDIAIVNLAVPLIQKDFGLANDSIHWIQTLYVLFYGGFLILGGKLADMIGRRNVFLLGSALFLVTSGAAGFASSFEALLIFRSVQGLGAALLMPSAVSIITNTFHEPHARNQALGLFGSFAAIGSGSGLSVGGLIASYFGWQWIFFINVPLIAISLVLALKYIPQDREEKSKTFPDVLASAFLTTAILVLTFVIHEMSALGENILQIVCALIAVILFLVAFYVRNKRPGSRLIDFAVYRNRPTITANAVIVMMGVFFSSYLLLISLTLQNVVGFSAAQAGLLLLPFSILSAVLSKSVIPKMMRRFSTETVAVIGMTLFFGGAASLVLGLMFDRQLALIVISVACVTGTGIAVCFSSLMVMAIDRLPGEQHGLASSIAQSSFFFGSGIGLSFVGLILGMEQTVSSNLIAAGSMIGLCAVLGIVALVVSRQRRIYKEVVNARL